MTTNENTHARNDEANEKTTPSAAACCPVTEQATCCEPSAKSACCGTPDPAVAPATRCGCR